MGFGYLMFTKLLLFFANVHVSVTRCSRGFFFNVENLAGYRWGNKKKRGGATVSPDGSHQGYIGVATFRRRGQRRALRA